MLFRNAKLSDLATICTLLSQSDLPAKDCRDHIDHFLILEINGKISGFAGLEYHGSYGLLRSVVIKAGDRNKGLGKAIVKKIIDQAHDNGIKALYLLTENACKYFASCGFNVVNRHEVPKIIQQTQQFSTFCPVSAVVMTMNPGD